MYSKDIYNLLYLFSVKETSKEMDSKLTGIDYTKAEKLIHEAHGLWRAQVLSSATELRVFDCLEENGNTPKTLQEVCDAAKIKGLRACDFFDALVAMGHIAKTEDGKYYNTPEGSAFLVRSSPHYIGI